MHRSYRARLGVAALNLISPGLGLIRAGNWRAGALAVVAPFALMALFTFGLGHLPITSYGVAVLALAALLVLLTALYIVPIVLTWRESMIRVPARWWSRWYSLTAIALVVLGLSRLAPAVMHRFYKPFYAPSASMAPTIEQGDKFVVDMRWRGPMMRGDIVVFRASDGDRISRIAGLPGDRIAMRDGVPIINGTAVSQRAYRSEVFRDEGGPRLASVLIERLPGELSAHPVLDLGPSYLDEMNEVPIPSGHFFVLGDNRDRAADSRAPPEALGVGMVPVTALLGRAMYIDWSSDRGRIGKRLEP